MSALAIDLRRTAGYIVADRQGRLVGKVECPMYGTAPDVPDALSVKSGLFSRRRRMVPADTIDQIDGSSGVIGLRVDRESIRSFLSPAFLSSVRWAAFSASFSAARPRV